MHKTPVRTLGWENPLEKEVAIHSSILAWRIPWTEEPDRLQSMGSQESDTTEWLKRERERKRDFFNDSHWDTWFVSCFWSVGDKKREAELKALRWQVHSNPIKHERPARALAGRGDSDGCKGQYWHCIMMCYTILSQSCVSKLLSLECHLLHEAFIDFSKLVILSHFSGHPVLLLPFPQGLHTFSWTF